MQTQFLHTVHCVILNNFYSQHWNWWLLPLFSLVLKKDVICVKFCICTKQEFNELMNGKSQANRDQKSNLLFLQQHDQSQKCWIKLVKNRQKNITKAFIFTIFDTLQLKNWWLWEYSQCKSFVFAC